VAGLSNTPRGEAGRSAGISEIETIAGRIFWLSGDHWKPCGSHRYCVKGITVVRLLISRLLRHDSNVGG
jgi:hypothetical protein